MNLISEELAKNPNTPLKILKELAKTSKDEVVLAAVAENPNTDAQLLIELFENYPYQVLNNPAIELILLEYPDLFERFYFKEEDVFFGEFRKPLRFLDWLVRNSDRISFWIGANNTIPIFYI